MVLVWGGFSFLVFFLGGGVFWLFVSVFFLFFCFVLVLVLVFFGLNGIPL